MATKSSGVSREKIGGVGSGFGAILLITEVNRLRTRTENGIQVISKSETVVVRLGVMKR